MRKLAYAATAVASLFVFASPAMATNGGGHHFPLPEDTLTVSNVNTNATNLVVTLGNSGLNFVSGGELHTGKAEAYSTVANTVNWTEVAGCGCFDDVTIGNVNTRASNYVFTVANSGLNFVSGSESKHHHHSSGGEVWTGAAVAGAVVVNDVNTTIVGDFIE